MTDYVIGDIHGRYEALVYLLKKCRFDYEKDHLIILGDVVDGGADTYKVVEELLKIKNKTYIIGNHDKWFIDFMSRGYHPAIWLHQGGENTVLSYGAKIVHEARTVTDEYTLDLEDFNVPTTHQIFFNEGVYYFHDKDRDYLFVHGGFNYFEGLEKTSEYTLMWDRNICSDSRYKEIPGFKKIFVGHSTTQLYGGGTLPIFNHNVVMLDTGAGWNGRLTIMNVDTEEFWQSELQKPVIR